MHEFQTPNPVSLRLRLGRGRVRVTASETSVTRIELTPRPGDSVAATLVAEAVVSQDGDQILVDLKSREMFWGSRGHVDVAISLPAHSRARITTGSAGVETEGAFADISVTTGSGAVRIANGDDISVMVGSGEVTIEAAAGDCTVKSGSGRIKLGSVAGDARVTTGSGEVTVRQAGGALKVVSGSGQILVHEAGEGVDVFTASGQIRIDRADHGRIRARTTSGKVTVGVANGAAAWLDVSTTSGRVHSALEQTAAPAEGDKKVELVIHTTSGNVVLDRA